MGGFSSPPILENPCGRCGGRGGDRCVGRCSARCGGGCGLEVVAEVVVGDACIVVEQGLGVVWVRQGLVLLDWWQGWWRGCLQ